MTYATAVKPVISASAQEQTLITIEFAPTIQQEETQYTYEHPQFVFGDIVTLANPGINYPLPQYTVRAIELIESKTETGQLLNQPCWKYKISDGQNTLWKDESALIRYQDQQSTCKDCPSFSRFNDYEEKGWCETFNQPAKTHHEMTHDCVLNHSSEIAFPTEELINEADKPYSEYEIGSIVKVINDDEDHQEWAIFEIIERRHNKQLYRSTDSYLNEAEWYFRLASRDNIPTTISPILWVGENEICFAEQSHNICTKEIF